MLRKNLVLLPRVKKKLKTFPYDVQDRFWKQVERLLKNKFHPSLRNKRVQGSETDWEFSINMNYRAIYRIVESDLVIVLIGKHEDVF